MNVDQIAQLVVTALTTIWGFRSVSAKLTNYVPVDLYRAKITDLHEQINALKVQVARLEERALK